MTDPCRACAGRGYLDVGEGNEWSMPCPMCNRTGMVPTPEAMAEEWRWGYRHGYLHGWSDHKAGKQYGEGRYLRKTPVSDTAQDR